MPRIAAGERGQDLRRRETRADLLRGRAERARQRRRVPGVERRRPGDEDRVDGRQGDERDRDQRQQHLVQPVGAIGPLEPPAARSAWAHSTATIPLTVIAMLTVPSTARRGRRAATRSPSSSGTGSRAEIAISRACAAAGGPRRRARGPCWSGRRGRRGRGSRRPRRASATAVTTPIVDSVERRARPRCRGGRRSAIGEQRSGQPSERQPGRGRDEGHDDVLGEQHGGDQARRAADRLEQPDAPDLVGHPAADEHREAGHGEQAPAARRRSAALAAGS